jgi:hypothetical protein
VRCSTGNFEDSLWKEDYFCSIDMSESTEFSFPPKVEVKIQLIIKNTGLTRTEVIKGLVLAFFDKRDSPKENVSAFVLLVKRALRELESGG